MKLLGAMWLAVTFLGFCFGGIQFNDQEVQDIGGRLFLATIIALIFTLIVGLPLLGVLSLFGIIF